MDQRLLLLIIAIIFNYSNATSYNSENKNSEQQWNYKFSFTKSVNSQLVVECEANDQIWIGWSHYGTRSSSPSNTKSEQQSASIKNSQLLNFPNENDCWMNFTEKIAEQCNGSPQCELSSQPTYIHKCGKTSDYLYVAYKCIKEVDTFDICKPSRKSYSYGQLVGGGKSFYLKSSDFPDEYSSSLDCSCSLVSSHSHHHHHSAAAATTNLKLDVLWFSLQDNDYLNMFNRNLSGWINPTYEMPILAKSNKIRFLTDDSLAYKGFWLKISSRKACKDDWQLVGDNCIKVFTSEQLDWRSANQKCLQMNGNLIKIDDVIADLKLTQYMNSFYPEVASYWIGLRKLLDEYNQERWTWSTNSTLYNDVSWWPWRKSSSESNSNNNCVVKKKNEDGYFTTSCDSNNKHTFICQTNTIDPIVADSNAEIRLECGRTSDVEEQLSRDAIAAAAAAAASTTSSKNNIRIELPKSIVLNDDTIGINSIKNVVITTTTSAATTTTSRQYAKITAKSAHKSSLYEQLTSSAKSVNKSPVDASIVARPTQTESRLNTTILAGIISGIGLVILIINIVVLVICRRQLKHFLRSGSQSSSSTTKSPSSLQSDMIQEYFDTFNTLHHSKTTSGQSAPSSHTLSSSKQAILINGVNGGDELLLTNDTPFYNTQKKQQQLVSAFKPFNRDSSQQQQQHQYDRMNHHSKSAAQNDSVGQYAHTYESLDALEMPSNNRGAALIHLGRNYRTLLAHQPPSTHFDIIPPNSSLSPNTSNTTNLTEVGNFNLSTSSSSSASSTSSDSSTAKFLPKQQQQQQLVNVQTLNQAQLIQFLNAQQQQQQPCACLPIDTNAIIQGTWSPDSAYYSAIPANLLAGNHYLASLAAGYTIQHQQPNAHHFLVNGGCNDNQFKSHLV